MQTTHIVHDSAIRDSGDGFLFSSRFLRILGELYKSSVSFVNANGRLLATW